MEGKSHRKHIQCCRKDGADEKGGGHPNLATLSSPLFLHEARNRHQIYCVEAPTGSASVTLILGLIANWKDNYDLGGHRAD